MIDWLKFNNLVSLPVYTKADKLSKNKQIKNAASLDAALTIRPEERLLFSSKTGQGREELRTKLALYGQSC